MDKLPSILSLIVGGALIAWAVQILVGPYTTDPILLALGIMLPILGFASLIAGILDIGK